MCIRNTFFRTYKNILYFERLSSSSQLILGMSFGKITLEELIQKCETMSRRLNQDSYVQIGSQTGTFFITLGSITTGPPLYLIMGQYQKMLLYCYKSQKTSKEEIGFAMLRETIYLYKNQAPDQRFINYVKGQLRHNSRKIDMKDLIAIEFKYFSYISLELHSQNRRMTFSDQLKSQFWMSKIQSIKTAHDQVQEQKNANDHLDVMNEQISSLSQQFPLDQEEEEEDEGDGDKKFEPTERFRHEKRALDLSRYQKLVLEQRQKKQKLKSYNNILKQKCSDYKKRIEQLQRQKANWKQIKDQKDSLGKTFEEKEKAMLKEILTLQGHIETIEEQKATKTKLLLKTGQLEAQLLKLKNLDNQAKERENQNLKVHHQQLSLLEHQNAVLKQQSSALKKQNTEIKHQTSRLKQQYSQVKSTLTKYADYEELQRQLQAQNQLIHMYQTEKTQLAEKEKQLQSLNIQTTALGNRIEELEAQKATSNSINMLNESYLHIFEGQTLHDCLDEKQYLRHEIENYSKKEVLMTKLIYRYDPLNKTNYHSYIDNIPHFVLVVKLKNGRLIAGYSVGPVVEGMASTEGGLILSLTQKKSYQLIEGRRSVTYDAFFLIFGNSELRIKHGDNKFFSNFGINNAYYNSKGDKYTVINGEGTERDEQLQTYEIFEMVFR